MKHSTKRGCILLVTFLFPLSAIIFPTIFRVESLEDLAWGFVIRGAILSLVGMMVIFDTFFFYRNGFFQKRNHKLIDAPFVISLILSLLASLALFLELASWSRAVFSRDLKFIPLHFLAKW